MAAHVATFTCNVCGDTHMHTVAIEFLEPTHNFCHWCFPCHSLCASAALEIPLK